MNMRSEAGWVGVFTREWAKGAIPNGTRIVKAAVDATGRENPIGTKGVVLGSIAAPPEVAEEARRKGLRPPDGYFYFVEWETMPRHAVGVMDWKIKEDQ